MGIAHQAVVVRLRLGHADTVCRVTDVESMTGGAALARQLRAEGVEVIFGVPGDQLMVALDALVDVPEIRYIVTRHEQATTYMADTYARTTRPSRRRDGRARRRRLQRGVGPRHCVRVLVAGAAARGPGEPRRDRQRPRAAARRARPARPRAPDHEVGDARARRRRDPGRGAHRVPADGDAAGPGPSRSRSRPRRSATRRTPTSSRRCGAEPGPTRTPRSRSGRAARRRRPRR